MEQAQRHYRYAISNYIRLLVPIAALFMLITSGATYAQDNNDCIECHQDPEQCGPKVKIDPVSGEIFIRSMLLSDENVETFKASAHGGEDFFCIDCHADLEAWVEELEDLEEEEEVPVHKPNLKPVDCITFCHDDPAADYLQGSHVQLMRDNNVEPMTCKQCHTGEHSRRDTPRAANPIGRSIMLGKCGSCHEAHLNSYRINLHGQLTALGYTGTDLPSCPDCHGKHTILNSSDPESTVGPDNVVQTCENCHEGATPNFAKHIEHPQFKNIDQYKSVLTAFKNIKSEPHALVSLAKNPQSFLILGFAIYMLILGMTFSAFGSHCLLMWFRTVIDELKGKGSKKHE